MLALPVVLAAGAEGPAPNQWCKVSENDVGPGFSPGLVWSPHLGRFIFFCGAVSHHFKGERPYDVLSFAPAARAWRNELPKGAESRGGEVGNVRDAEFKTPYFALEDAEGLVRPNRRHMCMWNHYALAPWDGMVYMLICGRVLRYDPRERTWRDLAAPPGPMPLTQHHREGLSWAALCADPVNRELLLFGGCGVLTENGSPGTWAYSPEKNEWRKLEQKAEPPPRALAPMAFDPATRKIVLFGGDGLDTLRADTWVYDCATRSWEERRPPLSPSPRFGHALLHLPRSGRIVLLGGKGYTSSTGYCATLYRPLPFEAWTYDVAGDKWELIRRWETDGPADYRERGGVDGAAAAAASDADLVLWVGAGTQKGSAHSSWLCQLDASKGDPEGTARHGVPPGTVEHRTGPFDPDWYVKDLPPPDPAAAEALLKALKPNAWTPLQCPRWPENRQGGGWSTVTLDAERGQLLHMGGGHSSYFGNDVAHYDIPTARWTIACRPQFALEYNYDLSGPGLWAFNGAPWGGHNYQAYEYDPTIQRLVYIKGHMTLFYDPATRTWPFAEKFGNLPFRSSKYVNYLCATPQGVVCWAQTRQSQSKTGLWRLEAGKAWQELETTGEPLPMVICDGSTLTYDSTRHRLLMTTTPDKKGGEAAGQVWACSLASGEVRKLDPAGREAIAAPRFAREAVYLPEAGLLMLGYLLEREGKLLVPFYDCAANRWLGAAMPGAEFFNAGKPGASVDLGLVYDPSRRLVWATLCNLRKEGALQVARIEAPSLGAAPLSR